MGKLLAKSGEGAPTILEHCREVRGSARAIMAAVGGALSSAAPGLPENLQELVEAAGILHDVLKATSAFQAMMQEGRGIKQPIRHEILAAVLLVTHQPLAEWFAMMVPDSAERWALVWAIAGHHLQMPKPAEGKPPIVRGDSE